MSTALAPADAEADVVIAGGGPVGCALALALATMGIAAEGIAARVRLLTPPGSGRYALRPVALADPSRRLLERLEVFDPARATPIRSIHVSQRGGFGRTTLAAAEHDLVALGWVVDLQDLAGRMLAAAAPVHIAGERVSHGAAPDGFVRVEYIGGDGVMRTIDTRLLVLADGAPERPPARDYRQTAIVATVESAPPPRGIAWERFTPEGPLALLPFGERYAIVWAVHPDRAPALLAADDAGFCAALQKAFGAAGLRFSAPGARVAYPLTLRRAGDSADAGVVAIGNAAQALHPVAGQGLNLGLRDVETLAQHIADTVRRDGAPALASPEFARAFARSRAFDRGATVAATDVLARAFTTDFAPLALARGLGLTMLEVIPPLRALVARRMMLGHRGVP